MKALVIICLLAHFSAVSQNIVQAEYFIDADQGVGKNTLVAVTPAADGTFSFNADLTGASKGYHYLYLRTLDSDGKWSITSRRNIEIIAENKNKIASGEYFIDDDPGFGGGSLITVTSPDSAILQNFTANVSTLQPGFHKLYGRMKDEEGRWSETFRRNIEVIKSADTGAIAMVEYFFNDDNGIGQCKSISFANPLKDGTFTFNIPEADIPANADSLFLRVKDTPNGEWSITQYRVGSITLPLTLLDFTALKKDVLVQLNWQTANEINVAYFNVQQSINGTDFKTIGKVTATGANGNTSYEYTDNITGIETGNVYYRLQIVDKDGSFAYSPVRNIMISNERSIAIHPNPVNALLNVTINNPARTHVSLSIYNFTGQRIFLQQFTVAPGKIIKQIDTGGFAAGTYTMQLNNGTAIQTLKFVKQ